MSITTTGPSVASANVADIHALSVLRTLEQAGITYCVLRGGDQLNGKSAEDEVDLLIPPEHLRHLCAVLHQLGFVRLRTWGHAPHYFFVSYDEATDRWLKLDVVTRVAYGRPTHELATDLGDNCLRNRQRMGAVFIPAPEDEIVTLLLHCVVDRGNFPLHWQRRLGTLCATVRDTQYVTSLLSKHCSSTLTFEALRDSIQQNQWDGLLGEQTAIRRILTAQRPVAVVACRFRDQVLRKLNLLTRFLRPHALSVALLAPDGAGKSTLAAGLCDHFFFPVDQIYMGLYQKRASSAAQQTPGFGLIGKLWTQWSRYVRGYIRRARGRFVIFDRYTYDALLPARYRLSRSQRLRRWLLAYSCPSPDVILLLDAPSELLFGRKHEHSVEFLEQHRQAYLRLKQQFPQMIVIDAARNADEVRRSVTAHIWRFFATRVNIRNRYSPALKLTRRISYEPDESP
jgi:hypothetical protein